MSDLLVVVPHPDDDVINCGGLVCKMARSGRDVRILMLTRGGAGRTLDVCSAEELPAIREEELRRALMILGVEHAIVMDFTDGGMGDQVQPATAAVRECVDRLRPAAVLTFPPNGLNGHPDHVATNEIVREALAATCHRPAVLYYFATETPFDGPGRPGYLESAEVRRLHLPPTHHASVGRYLEDKLRAMGQHETQARSILRALRESPERLLTESFHQAYPGTGDGPAIWVDSLGFRK